MITTRQLPKFLTGIRAKLFAAMFAIGFIVLIAAALGRTTTENSRATSNRELGLNPAVIGAGQREHPRSREEEQRLRQENTHKAQALYQQQPDPLFEKFLGLSKQGGFLQASRAAEKIFDRGSSKDIAFLFSILAIATPEAFTDHEWQAMQARSLDYLVEEWPQHQQAESRLLSMLNSDMATEYVKNGIVARADTMFENSQQPQRIASLLWEASGTEKNDIAATALTALSRISYHTNEIDTQRLHKLSLTLVDADHVSTKTRVVAMEVANWLKSPEVESQALKILKSPNQPEEVQLSAINTLIRSGDSGHIPLIKDVGMRMANPDMKRAAAQAIILLNKEGTPGQ